MNFLSPLFRQAFGTPLRFTVFTNTTSQILGRIIQSGSTFLITLILARTFGPRGFGDYIKVVAYVPLFYILADFGMNAVFIRESRSESRNPSLWQSLLSTRFILTLVFTALSACLLYILPSLDSRGFTPFVKLGVLIFLPTILFQGFITSANAAFQKHKRYDLSAWAICGGSLISVIGTYIAVLIGKGSVGILYSLFAVTVGSLVNSMISLFSAVGLEKPVFHPFNAKSSFSLVKMSIPLAATLISNLLYFRADIFILTYLRTTSEVGVYGFAYRFFEFALVIPTFFMNAVYPILVSSRTEEGNFVRFSYNRLVKKSGKLLIISGIIMGCIVWTAAPLLGRVRPEFAESAVVLRILSLGLPVFFLTGLTMWMIITEGKYVHLALIYFCSMLLNVLLNIGLIPKYGMYAAAWITTVSELVTLVISSVYLYRQIVVTPVRRQVQ